MNAINSKFSWLMNECLPPAQVEKSDERVALLATKIREDILSLEKKWASFVDVIQQVRQKWEDNPYRGEKPEFSIIINSVINSRGELVVSWSPYFPKPFDVKTCQSLMLFNFGKGCNEIKVAGVELLANMVNTQFEEYDVDEEVHEVLFFARNNLWALSILPKYFSGKLPDNIPNHVGLHVEFTYKCSINNIDSSLDEYEEFLEWISSFEERFVIPLGVMVYLCENEYTPQMVRDVSKVKYNREMSYSDAHHALNKIRDIKFYNDSRWRRTQTIKLPEAEEPQKLVPEQKVMIQKSGKKARVSPIGVRGSEGTNVVEKSALLDAINQRIEENEETWHFTAGDFSDLVSIGDRDEVVRELIKKKNRNEIHSVYKGIYSRVSVGCNVYLALEALMRDRAEKIVSSPERAYAIMGIKGNPMFLPDTFYTNGPIRSFFACGVKVKLFQEVLPTLCDKALEFDNPDAFIASVSALLEGDVPIDMVQDACSRHNSIYEFEQAQRFVGRFT